MIVCSTFSLSDSLLAVEALDFEEVLEKEGIDRNAAPIMSNTLNVFNVFI